ncbi:MAG: PadR family transcriptional regulator [Cyclobacteriaceae bacterium]
MNKYDPQLLKGIYPTLILKLLSRNDEMYGYQIEKNIKILSDSGFAITEGSLYPILHKLEEKGFIKSKVKTVKNRDRKYYSITALGGQEFTNKETEIKSIYGHLIDFLAT